MDALLVLGLVVAAIAMFASERIPLEVASLALLVLIAGSGILSPEETFAGISNDTVIFIFALLAMTEGLGATGVMRIVGARLAVARRFGERTFLAGLMIVVASFSSVASNTAVTAAFLPIVSASAARAKIPRSRVLLPLAYASMLGGMIFLFGSSTNLVVSEAMEGLGLRPLGFAELTPVGLPAAAVAIVLVVFASGRLIPVRAAIGSRPLDQRQFVTEVTLPANVRKLGRTVGDLGSALDVEIVGVRRGPDWHPGSVDLALEPGDRLLLRGGGRAVLQAKELAGLAGPTAAGEPVATVLAEAFVPPHSPLVGHTTREFLFEERLGLAPLAIHRHPEVHGGDRPISEARSLGRVRLAAGDVLLLGGAPSRLRELANGELLAVLGNFPYRRPRYRRAAIALAIFAASLLAAGTSVLPPAIAGLLGLLTMIGTGCVDVGEAFRIEWRIVLLIGALLALGRAMEQSGAGALVAEAIVPLGASIGNRGLLFLVMLLTVVLSAPMSNQAAALVVLPVAVHVADLLGTDPRPFAIATCLAASCSFVTPLEPSAALVYGPGHYRFSDFVRMGTPVTLVLLGLLALLVPIVWPF